MPFPACLHARPGREPPPEDCNGLAAVHAGVSPGYQSQQQLLSVGQGKPTRQPKRSIIANVILFDALLSSWSLLVLSDVICRKLPTGSFPYLGLYSLRSSIRSIVLFNTMKPSLLLALAPFQFGVKARVDQLFA